MDDFGLLRQFLAVAKAGTVSGAALALAVSQPSLTKSIQRLERELGVRLFERHARGVALTKVGGALLRHAEAIGRQWAFARAELSALRRGAGGQLRIGAGPWFGVGLLPRAIAQLRARFPGLRIDLDLGVNTTLLPRLFAGELDVVFGRIGGAVGLPGYIAAQRLRDIRVCPVAARGHPLWTQKRPTLADLARHPWVVYQEDAEVLEHMMATFRAHGTRPPDVAVETTSLMVVSQVLHAGPYLAFMPEGVLALPLGLGLREVPVAGSAWRFVGGAMFARAQAAMPALRGLIRLVQDQAPLPAGARSARMAR